jgi:glyoxylase-like metal-dependent hydrolase (beta-lactamase superfamily II)
MQLYSIDTGYFKLDGGAMFGVVPKMIWDKLNPADSRNLCTWAMRCMLIEDGDRLTLIDTGLGDKQSEKFFSYYEPFGDATLLSSLKKHGFGPDDITDVILTHLHFDHCGAAVSKLSDGTLVPTFKNATYWSNEKHWDWAVKPNAREKASFLKENFMPIQENGQLKFVNENEFITANISAKFVNGHTESMLLPHINYKGQTLVYMADLFPSHWHLPVSYIMGYDIRPLDCMQERIEFLQRGIDEKHIFIFEHDPKVEACSLIQNEKGIRMHEPLLIKDL